MEVRQIMTGEVVFLSFLKKQRNQWQSVGGRTGICFFPLSHNYPSADGRLREMIEPLHPVAPKACLKDTKLYEYLALCDALRAGKAREKNLAMVEFKKRLC